MSSSSSFPVPCSKTTCFFIGTDDKVPKTLTQADITTCSVEEIKLPASNSIILVSMNGLTGMQRLHSLVYDTKITDLNSHHVSGTLNNLDSIRETISSVMKGYAHSSFHRLFLDVVKHVTDVFESINDNNNKNKEPSIKILIDDIAPFIIIIRNNTKMHKGYEFFTGLVFARNEFGQYPGSLQIQQEEYFQRATDPSINTVPPLLDTIHNYCLHAICRADQEREKQGLRLTSEQERDFWIEHAMKHKELEQLERKYNLLPPQANIEFIAAFSEYERRRRMYWKLKGAHLI